MFLPTAPADCRLIRRAIWNFSLKPISKGGIPAAISKVEVYRYLNEPGEAESICRDILAIEPDNQDSVASAGSGNHGSVYRRCV